VHTSLQWLFIMLGLKPHILPWYETVLSTSCPFYIWPYLHLLFFYILLATLTSCCFLNRRGICALPVVFFRVLSTQMFTWITLHTSFKSLLTYDLPNGTYAPAFEMRILCLPAWLWYLLYCSAFHFCQHLSPSPDLYTLLIYDVFYLSIPVRL
jgi:hypothetical protein